MATKKHLASISVITDDDTGMYHLGEIDGGFDTANLDQYLRQYGKQGRKDLIEHLAYVQTQVILQWKRIHDDDQSNTQRSACQQ